MLKLPNVTLVAVSSVKIRKTVAALKISMKNIEYAEVVLISHRKPWNLPPGISFRKCPQKIQSLDQYSKYMLYDLREHIRTDFALVIQYDGYVLRPHKWNDDFLNYDYIGAPWQKNVHFTGEGINIRVGNGGFSLRSKRLLDSMHDLGLPFDDNGTGFYNEDGLLCVRYRKKLEEHGIRYAPVETASAFSREGKFEDSCDEPFGFHKNI